MNEFLIFTLSGIIVAWVPLVIGFVVQHWRLRVYIDKRTSSQTGDIRQLTDIQTADIAAMTDRQTQTLTEAKRRRLRRSSNQQGD